ncbi:MAG TPA: fibrinogen-like YCDxxxxGGGW domain-containing protein, partial [Archangium sp.]|nr:fibrinogen-like YCDxxxxGGGW domain-containing protein [Archangium sp.]
VPLGGQATRLVAGAAHTCALMKTGAVRCWGLNAQGQLGYGHTRSVGDDESPASAGNLDLGGSTVQLVTSSTSQHTCSQLGTGTVRCWGLNAWGQLGYGHTRNVGDDESPATAGVSVAGTVLQVTTGAEHTCALRSSGSLECWGRNESGQLGQGNDTTLSAPPTASVALGTTAFQLAAGAWHTCALVNPGAVRCWGRNTWGQLGLGHTSNLGDNEPPTSPPNPTLLSPRLVESFQSALTVPGSGAITVRVRAMDPQGSALSFSWSANVGTLSTPTTEEGTSEVLWTAPSFCGAGESPLLTLTAANALGRSISTTFTLAIEGCTNCANILRVRPSSPSGLYRLDPDGTGTGAPFDAYCDMTQDSGGWTLLGRGTWGSRESSSLPPGTNALLPASLRTSVLSTTGRLFRLGSGTSRLFISDASPVLGAGDGVWRSTAPSVRCTTSYARVLANTMATTSTKKVSCDPTVIGTHTCGFHGGWVLTMFYDTYNFEGGHPCAFSTGHPPGNTLLDLWVR